MNRDFHRAWLVSFDCVQTPEYFVFLEKKISVLQPTMSFSTLKINCLQEWSTFLGPFQIVNPYTLVKFYTWLSRLYLKAKLLFWGRYRNKSIFAAKHFTSIRSSFAFYKRRSWWYFDITTPDNPFDCTVNVGDEHKFPLLDCLKINFQI